jgi:ligand-binding sensor domain-containing protein
VTRRRITEPTHGASIARHARAALLGVGLALIAMPARAQELRFRQLTPDAGLSSSYVQSIFQDRTGFLWFGTDKGLDRYDGYVVHNYRHRRADPRSIADGTIHVLHADRGDTMWVGTNVGLSRYDADRDAFINYTVGRGERTVHDIADEPRGGLWIAADDGLYRFDRATGSAALLDGAAGSALRGVPILALHTDRRGQLWIGTQGHGLLVLDPSNGTTRRYGHSVQDPRSLPDDDVRRIVEDATGALWIGTWNGGLARLSPETGEIARYQHDDANPRSLGANRVVSLAPAPTGWRRTAAG